MILNEKTELEIFEGDGLDSITTTVRGWTALGELHLFFWMMRV